MEVCATCFTNSVNRQGECVCSYGNGPILEIDKRTLKKIHFLEEKGFEIKLRQAKQILKI